MKPSLPNVPHAVKRLKESIASHHAWVVDFRHAALFTFKNRPDLLHDAVLTVVEVAVHVQRVQLVTDANGKLVGENVSSRIERDLRGRAAHLHDAGRPT